MKRNPVILQLFFCFCVYTSSQDEISCDLPHYEHVTNPLYHFGGDKGLGVTKSYVCDSGFKKGAELAMCTENGWFPKPLCTEIVCSKLTIGNAKPLEQLQLTYKPGARIEYQCLHQSETDRFYITCNQNGNWDNVRGCTEQSTCSKPEGIQNGIIKEPPSVKDYYARGRTVEYKCSEGYVFENEDSARCVGPHWTYPKCIQLTCEIPRDEHVYFPYYYFGGDRRQGVRKSYRCESGYRKAAEEATCTKNGWVPKPLCTEIACPKLTIENANPLEKLQDTYKPGARVYYRCEHEPESRWFYISCNRDGDWDNKDLFLRRCIQQSTCSKPEGIQNGIIKEPPSVEDYYAKGRTVEYTCSEGYVFENEDSARCVGPHWTYPKCILTTKHCSQPPSIPDAVLDFKYRYEDGERLRLDCPAYYVQEGDQYLTCRGGGWIGKGKCLKPCTVDVQVLDNNNIKLLRGGRQKIYSQHGDHISFVCKGRLTFAKDSVGYRQQCTDGHIPLPVCE